MEYVIYREDEMGEEHEYVLEVDYHYYKGCKGHCDKYGVPEEPDDDQEIEIQSVTHNGVDFELTDKENNRLMEACWENLEEKAYNDWDED